MHTQWIYLSCFCLAVLWCSVSGSNNGTRQLSTQDDFDCTGRHGFFADIKSNCSLFYHCQEDLKLKLACSPNLWFNQKRLQCIGGDRKLCKNSKLYYDINNKLLNPRKISGKLLSRTKRQIETLYLPPSSINTFVVRYYLPTGSASVNEEDSFGNNGAIYLPESYRVPMNPDSEIPIPQNKKPTRKNLRNQYLNKDSSQQLPIQEQKVTTEKPVKENFSTRKPELEKDRIIHPTNGFRPSESPRNRNSNYDPRNSQIYHPRKAGSKLYHPGDYSSPPIYRETAPTERSYGYNDYRQRYLSHPNNFYGDDDDDDDDDDYDYFPRDRYPYRYPPSSNYNIYQQNSPRYPDSNPYPYSKVINLNVGRPQRPSFPERPLYSSPLGSRNGNDQNGNWEPSGNYRRPNNEDNSSQYREKPKDSSQYQDSKDYHDEQNENISKNHKNKKPETDYYDKDAKKESPHPNHNYKNVESESDDNENYRHQRTYSKNKEQDYVNDSDKSDGEYSKNSESYKPKDTFSGNRDQENLSEYSANNQNSEIRYEDPRGEITKRPIPHYPREVKTDDSENDDKKTTESSRYYEPREPYPERPRTVDSDISEKPDYYDPKQEQDRDPKVIQSNKPPNIKIASQTSFQDSDGRIPVYPERSKLEDSRNSGRPEYYKPKQHYVRPENEETKVIFPEKPRIEEVRISEDPTDSRLTSQYPEKEIIEDSRLSDTPKYEDFRNKPTESEKPIIHYLDNSNPEIPKTEEIRPSEDSGYEDSRNVYPQRPKNDFRESERPLYQNHEPDRPNIKNSEIILPKKPYVEQEVSHDSKNTKTRPEYPEKPISEDVRISERPEIQYPVIIDLDRPKTDRVRIQENPNYQERPRYEEPKYSQVRPELEEPKNNQERPRYEEPKYSQVRPELEEPKNNQERPRYEEPKYSQVRPELEEPKNNQERPRYEEPKYSQVRPELEEPKNNQERPRYEDSKYSQIRPEYDDPRNNQEKPAYDDDSRNKKLIRPEINDPKVTYLENFETEDSRSSKKPRFQDSRNSPERPIIQDYINEPKHKFEDSPATNISPIQNPKVIYGDNLDQHQKYPEITDVVIPERPNYKTVKISENPTIRNSPKESYRYQTSTYPKSQEFRVTNPVTPNYQTSEKLINTHSTDKYPQSQSEDNRENHRYEDLRGDEKERIPSNKNIKVHAYNDRQKTGIPERNRNLENIKQSDIPPRFSSNNRQKIYQITKEPTYFNKYEDDKDTIRTIIHTTPLSTTAEETTTEENISHLFEKEKFGDRIKSPSTSEQGKISKNNNNNQDASILEISQKQVNKPDSGNTFIIPFVMYKSKSNKQSNPSQIGTLNDGKEFSSGNAAVSYGNSNISPEKSYQNTNQRFSESKHKQEEKSEFATVSAPWTTSLTGIESVESTTEIIDTTTRRPRRRKPKRRRRKHGRRRRPKRPRLQNTTMSDDQSQIFHSYTETPLTSIDQVTTLYITQASSDLSNKQVESDTTQKQYQNKYDTTAQYTQYVTTSFPTETTDGKINWHRDDELASRPEIKSSYSSSEETEKRKMSFRHRPRYFKTRNVSNSSTSSNLHISSEISTQKPFTFQKLDEIPMTEPMTTSRPRAIRTRSKLMREKYRKRPRLFNFGKPKSSDDYVSTIQTTSFPTTIIHQESS